VIVDEGQHGFETQYQQHKVFESYVSASRIARIRPLRRAPGVSMLAKKGFLMHTTEPVSVVLFRFCPGSPLFLLATTVFMDGPL